MDRRIREIVECYASATPEDVEQRLRVMDGEWDLDRAVRLASGLIAVGGLLAGWKRPRWMALPLALLALSPFEPLGAILRAVGFRASIDIDRERRALEMLSG